MIGILNRYRKKNVTEEATKPQLIDNNSIYGNFYNNLINNAEDLEQFKINKDFIKNIDCRKELKIIAVNLDTMLEKIKIGIKSLILGKSDVVIILNNSTIKLETNNTIEIISVLPFILDNNEAGYYGSASVFYLTAFKSIELCGISNDVYGAYLFCECSASSIIIHDMTVCETMDGMFSGCRLDKLDITGLKTRDVRSMNETFNRTQIKHDITFDFDTSKVKTMIKTFDDFVCLDIDLSKLNLKSLVNCRYMFISTKSTNLNLGKFKTHRNCDKLGMFEYSTINNCNTSNKDVLDDYRFVKKLWGR